jgi:hypothetical protein
MHISFLFQQFFLLRALCASALILLVSVCQVRR